MNIAERFMQYVDLNGPMHPTRPQLGRCHLWVGAVAGNGYGAFQLGVRRQIGAHVFAFTLAHGKPPSSTPLVLHSCDRPLCCNDAHLRAGTFADNRADCVARGRQARGERVHCAKLTASDVIEVRRLRSSGATQRMIAERFGVARQSVASICSGKNWGHV